MTGVVQSGSGFRAAGDYEAAGKTGTSENNRSAWFVGYTPNSSPPSASSARTPRATRSP